MSPRTLVTLAAAGTLAALWMNRRGAAFDGGLALGATRTRDRSASGELGWLGGTASNDAALQRARDATAGHQPRNLMSPAGDPMGGLAQGAEGGRTDDLLSPDPQAEVPASEPVASGPAGEHGGAKRPVLSVGAP